MRSKKSNKKELITSGLSLTLCGAMFVGSTFAWFTDSATTGVNTIQAGNLKVDLVDSYNNSLEGKKISFKPKGKKELQPGETFATGKVFVKNNGKLDIKYGLKINGVEDTDAIDFTVKMGEEIAQDINSYTGTLDASELSESIVIEAKMKESAGNEYQNLSIEDITITVVATQNNSNAVLPQVNVIKDSTDLTNELTNPEAGEFVNLVLSNNIEIGPLNGREREVGSETTKEVVIDGNGQIFKAVGNGDRPMMMKNSEGTLILKNMTIIDTTVGSETNAENSWEYGYLEFGGKVKFENVTFENAIMLEDDVQAEFINCTFNSNKQNEYAVWVSDGRATFTNSTFSGARAVKIHEAYGSNVDSVVIDNCTFNNILLKPGVAIGDVDATTVVTIKGSTFENCAEGDQGLHIYESDTDVDTFQFITENNTIK